MKTWMNLHSFLQRSKILIRFFCAENLGLKQGRCSCTEAIGYAWGTTGPVQRKRDVLQHPSKSWRACNDMLIWKRRVKTSDDRLALQHPIPAPHTISVLLPKMYLIEILTKKKILALNFWNIQCDKNQSDLINSIWNPIFLMSTDLYFSLSFFSSLSKHSLCVNISDQPTLRCFELHKDVNLGFYISCLFKKNSVAFYGKKKKKSVKF